jgi:phage terminase large subunit-like protein
MARKNGKSAIGSGIGLWSLIMGPNGGEVYSCAADKDQARIVFGDAEPVVLTCWRTSANTSYAFAVATFLSVVLSDL